MDEELEIRMAAVKKHPTSEGSLTVDVFRDGGDIVIQSTIAGAGPQDLDIDILDDMVTIRGARRPEWQIPKEDYYFQELYWGPFSRSIILPEEVDSEGAKAGIKNGLLTIRLPTLQKAKTKKLKVELK